MRCGSADARAFTQQMASVFVSAGVTFIHSTPAVGVHTDASGRVVHEVALADGRTLSCDALVIAAGVKTRTLVQRWFRQYIPVHSMRGYSLGLCCLRLLLGVRAGRR